MVVRGGGAVSYERGTPVGEALLWLGCLLMERRGTACLFGVEFISQKRSLKSFCKSQFLHKSVNLSFIITSVKNKLTDFGGN